MASISSRNGLSNSAPSTPLANTRSAKPRERRSTDSKPRKQKASIAEGSSPSPILGRNRSTSSAPVVVDLTSPPASPTMQTMDRAMPGGMPASSAETEASPAARPLPSSEFENQENIDSREADEEEDKEEVLLPRKRPNYKRKSFSASAVEGNSRNVDEESNLSPISRKSTPKRRKRSSSEPRSLKPGDVDDMIRHRLRERAPGEPADRGLVYIAKVVGQENVYKVGSTGATAWKRMNNIEYKCGLQLTVEHRSELDMVFYARAEKLSHDELLPFQKSFSCPNLKCETDHQEYFELPFEEIKAVVLRWERFLLHEPYTAEGNLSDLWLHRLGDHRRPPEKEILEHHAQRGQRWELFINLTMKARVGFQIRQAKLWFKKDFVSLDFWKLPLLFLGALALFLTWLDNGFEGDLTHCRVFLELLRAVPLLIVGGNPLRGRRRLNRPT